MDAQLRIERLVAGGDGLAREGGGRVVFVHGGLPGELVSVEPVAEKKDFARARVVEVLETAAARREIACPHRLAGCGGCAWMHLDLTAQRSAKVDIVRESLARIGRLDGALIDELVRQGGGVDPVGTRTTVRVAAGADGRPGFRAESSSEVVAIERCRVAHPRLSDLLGPVRLVPGAELTLRTSVATGETTAWWSAPGPGDVVHGLAAVVRTGREAWLDERIAGMWLRVSARSFFQPGPQAAELLVDAVGRAADAHLGAPAVDAYGGVGLFAATVLASAPHVTLLESSGAACRDARHNLRDRPARVLRTDVGRWRPERRGPAPLVVADPARPGLGRPGTEALTAARPRALVLVSCDPVSLARDTLLLGEAGYAPRQVEVLDLFPETPHVETVTLFEPQIT